MQRLQTTPRPNWRERFDELGFTFHSMDGGYWREGAYYAFSAAQIDYLDDLTLELHSMCLQAAEHVISDKLFEQFRIPAPFAELLRDSWQRRDPSLYGRFDLCWDGSGDAKLLEYNADTPTSLVESSVAQWVWLEECFADADQFNSLHEQLLARFQAMAPQFAGNTLFFTCVREHEEDLVTSEYLRDLAIQAGITTKQLFIDEIGFHHGSRTFYDLDEEAIWFLFKLYPWEWLMAEEFGAFLPEDRIRLLEPAWKAILSNKALLPLLWRLFPDHPNLLPSFFDESKLWDGDYVQKPIFAREGANVTFHSQGRVIEASGGKYGSEGFIYQRACPLPVFDGRHAVIGSWIVGDRPAGIGIREDSGLITKNSSAFVPHLFR